MRLYCYSEERAKKEEGIARRFAERFESELRKLHEGLSRPRTRKGLDSVWQRIGRIQERCRGAGQHYTVDVVADPHSAKAVAVTWKPKPLAGTMLTHPGVYCLRSNVHDWDPQTLWRTYTMLTDLEAVFRSLKSELGLRPIFHKTQNRSDGHLFIIVIAYQLVQTIRRRLAEHGENASWTSLRRILQGQQCHRLLPPKGWPYPPRPQGHPCRATTTQNLHRSRSPPRTRWCHQIDRLNTLTVEM